MVKQRENTKRMLALLILVLNTTKNLQKKFTYKQQVFNSIQFRAVCFVFERARAPRNFFLVKGTLQCMMKLQVCTGAFKVHQGDYQGAWRQSPSLPPWSIRPVNSIQYKSIRFMSTQFIQSYHGGKFICIHAIQKINTQKQKYTEHR